MEGYEVKIEKERFAWVEYLILAVYILLIIKTQN